MRKYHYICVGQIKKDSSSSASTLCQSLLIPLDILLRRGLYLITSYMRQFKLSVALLLLLAVAPSLFAQKQRTQEFKDKYTLTEAVVLSRHNIRAPLSTKGSLLEKVTTHPWFA